MRPPGKPSSGTNRPRASSKRARRVRLRPTPWGALWLADPPQGTEGPRKHLLEDYLATRVAGAHDVLASLERGSARSAAMLARDTGLDEPDVRSLLQLLLYAGAVEPAPLGADPLYRLSNVDTPGPRPLPPARPVG